MSGMPPIRRRSLSSVLTQNIAAERVRRRMDQGELARLIGVDRSTITRIENGDRTVKVDELVSLCQALDVPLIKLAEGVDPADLRLMGLAGPGR